MTTADLYPAKASLLTTVASAPYKAPGFALVLMTFALSLSFNGNLAIFFINTVPSTSLAVKVVALLHNIVFKCDPRSRVCGTTLILVPRVVHLCSANTFLLSLSIENI